MDERRGRVLILDVDCDALIRLEQVLEDGGFDTTATWDASEARQLLASDSFDLLLLADHPPEVDAEKILDDLRAQRRSCACLVLRPTMCGSHPVLRSLGAVGVLPKWDHLNVLEQVRRHLRSVPPRVTVDPSAMGGAGCGGVSVGAAAAHTPRRKAG